MKISKLFHWLYAVVMLLPIFAIGVTCGYAMFNKNAYNSWSLTQSSEYTLIDNQTQLNEDEIYKFSANRDLYNSRSLQTINIEVGSLKIITGSTNTNFLTAKSFEIYYNGNIQSYSLHVVYGTNSNHYQPIGTYDNPSNYQFTFIPTQNYSNNDYLTNIQKVQFGEQNYLDNVFYYSIDKVQQSPLFNWAENSFLVTPFAYIVSLFSMPTNSPIVMFLSYWLAISIIWLVFDLIMYVPLLVHRWLDKGVLE